MHANDNATVLQGRDFLENTAKFKSGDFSITCPGFPLSNMLNILNLVT